MFDIDVFLKDLILNNRRVIIPEIGSFIHKEDGEGLVFSSFLRYNDGFLEESLQSTGMPPDEAAQLSKGLSESISSAMKNQQRYYISDLGYFVSDDKGINFVISDFKQKPVEEQQPAYVVPSSNPSYNAQPESNTSVPVYPEKRKKKYTGVILATIAVILLSAGGAYFYILKSNNSKNDPIHNTLAVANPSSAGKPEAEAKPSDVTNSDNKPATATSTNNAISSLNYHVIGGCFSEKVNAERFLKECRDNGFANAVILPQIGDLFPVSVDKYSTLGEAERKKSEYNDKYDSDAWVYKTR